MSLSTKTQRCTFPKYSKAARLPAGEVLRSETFEFHGRFWRIKVYPAGLSADTRDFVAVFVKCRTDEFGRFELTIAILDSIGQNTVFDDATARSTLAVRDDRHSRGYVRFAKRRELEASSCLLGDSLTVRCTLRVDATVVPKPSAFPWFTARNRKPGVVGGGAMNVPTKSLTYMDAGASSSSTSTRAAPEIVTGSHTLTIEGFSAKKALLQCGECVRSAQFGVGGSSWYIKVYPNGHDDSSKDSVSCFLARAKSGEPETTAEFTFELVNLAAGTNNDNKSAKATKTFGNGAGNAEHLGLQRLAADLQQQMGSADRLVVRCGLGVFRGKPPSALLAEQPTIAVPPDDELPAAFLWLLNSKEWSDVTYEVGGIPFRAHSCVLAARSKVFRQQLRELNDGQDNLWRNVQNEDEELTAEAFEALLYVVYTDQLPDMTYVDPTEETVEAMLFAAERYDVERLKLRCQEWLCTLVTPFTVADILSMAVRFDCQLLRDACVRYAAPGYIWDRVKETEGFVRLRTSYPDIVREIESKQRKY